MLHPWQRDTGKYAAQRPNIMSPVGGIFPEARGHGCDIDIIKCQYPISRSRAVYWISVLSISRPRAAYWVNINPLHIGFHYCQYAPVSISTLVYYNVNITPMASGHWKICRPRATLCRPRAPGCCPLAASWGPLAT